VAARWTIDEVAVLQQYYTTDITACIRLLPSRSRAAMYAKANKIGLSRRNKKEAREVASTTDPKPFVKWAGGKRKLLNDINEVLPNQYNNYYEPFVGGGALLYHLDSPNKIYIGDANVHLIEVYQYLKTKSVKTLIKHLKKHENTKEYFLKIRAQDPAKLTLVQRVARFIYLNKTCFNGLWRENSRGQFNVPFGSYKNPLIVDEETLAVVAKWLRSKDITIIPSDYKATLTTAQSGDFVYLDPPYDREKVSSFTKYVGGDFTRENQIELREEVRRLVGLGVKVLISNANTEFIRDLYKEFELIPITTFRAINSDGKGRGSRPMDLLIKTY